METTKLKEIFIGILLIKYIVCVCVFVVSQAFRRNRIYMVVWRWGTVSHNKFSIYLIATIYINIVINKMLIKQ